MKIRPVFTFGLLWLLGATAALAHDTLQANTNIWLRPDSMEVELIMARNPTRALVENPPPVPVTEDNFESTYHAALQKSAATMLEISLDGQPLVPRTTTVELFEETDIKFTFTYARPPNGKLRVNAAFVKKMDEGYVNTLGMNEDRKVLGYGDQSADDPNWEINLGQAKGIPSPSVGVSPPPPTPTTLLTPAPPKSSVKSMGVNSDFVIVHISPLTYAALAGIIALLIIWEYRRKNRAGN